MIKTEFMELYEELSFLNEAYNILYSGYVVINEDGEYFSKEFLETGNLRKAWTDNIQEAAVYKEETKANKAKAYCFELYDGKLDFFIKHVESEAALEHGEIEKKLFDILEVWENFVETGVVLQKLCNQDDFKKFVYSVSAYKSKKAAPDLLIYILTSDDNVEDVVRKLGAFLQEIIKASKRSEDDQELNKKARDFIQAWNNVVQKACRDTTLNLRLQMVELLKNI
jgi:hypothetical protein